MLVLLFCTQYLYPTMTASLPFEIETTGWNDLNEVQRDFFCFEEEYLPLPEQHLLQIHRLSSSSAERVWRWLGPSLPSGWPESEPHFSDQTAFQLDHGDWNSAEDVQSVRQWLHDLGVAYASDVFLVYESNKIVRMPWKLVVKYWDALAWSVGYAMIAMDPSRQWACCFHHENVIVFGKFPESPTS